MTKVERHQAAAYRVRPVLPSVPIFGITERRHKSDWCHVVEEPVPKGGRPRERAPSRSARSMKR